MVSNRSTLAQPLRMLFHVGTVAGLTDAELLERFASRGHEESELAFAALVERHGTMVHAVIRRVLSNPHDAQDAFQATFLVLLRSVHSIRKRASLVSWLHGVALRVAWASRLKAARHRKHEQRKAAAAPRLIHHRDQEVAGEELGPTIHQELSRLPERYRAPLILCYLEGLTHEQAAARLVWPVGTVKSRLSRGRDRLRDRLLRRGVAPSAGVIDLLSFGMKDSTPLSQSLVDTTVQAALHYVASRANPGAFATTARTLAEEAMKSMLSVKLTSGLLALVVVAAGGAVLAQKTGANRAAVEPPASPASGRILALGALAGSDTGAPSADEIWKKFVEARFLTRSLVIEKIAEQSEACKIYPLAGPCQLVHQHFKCTLSYYEKRKDGKEVEPGVEIIFIDKDHLRRCTNPSHPHPPGDESTPRPAPVPGSPPAPAVAPVAPAAPLAPPAGDGWSDQLGDVAPVAPPAPAAVPLLPTPAPGLPGGPAAVPLLPTVAPLAPPAPELVPPAPTVAPVAPAAPAAVPPRAEPAGIPDRAARIPTGKTGRASRPSTTPSPYVAPAPEPYAGGSMISDQERRLAEVEQKLDRVLRLLEASKAGKE